MSLNHGVKTYSLPVSRRVRILYPVAPRGKGSADTFASMGTFCDRTYCLSVVVAAWSKGELATVTMAVTILAEAIQPKVRPAVMEANNETPCDQK